MRIKMVALSAALMFMGALAACSNAGNGDGGPVACPQLILAPPQLLFPIPGATAVPVSAGFLVVGNVGPAGGTLTLVPTSGSTIVAGALGPAPSPLPSPAAAGASSTTSQAAPIPTLFGSTTYTVVFSAANSTSTSNPCGNPQASGTIGTFTTR